MSRVGSRLRCEDLFRDLNPRDFARPRGNAYIYLHGAGQLTILRCFVADENATAERLTDRPAQLCALTVILYDSVCEALRLPPSCVVISDIRSGRGLFKCVSTGSVEMISIFI